jgi:UDP-N-acetylglucosamine--N-acetylmuramyl-(pentapeptide) pyrophosphoryl-undecaprenol N-acetylglucosamine transferase
VKVVIAGGGTAGHVNPAIALAAALGDAEITFIGTARGVEARLVPEAGFSMEEIEVKGFDRSKPWSLISTGLTALGAVRASRRLLKEIRPDVVVGMGGYVSLPVTWAARSVRVAVVLHEQNIVLGLAHKVTRRRAERIAVSFEETLREVGSKGVFTGNPVSEDLVVLDRDEARRKALETFDLEPGRTSLLVFGGSQGAARLNEAAAGLADLWRDRADVQVLHITGTVAHEAMRARIDRAGGGSLVYRVVPYLSDMGLAYAVADLALCRGGATTVAELGVTGVPSIIVPYPYHRDRQQERHGRVMEREGAALVLPDAEATTERVAEIAGGLLVDRGSLAEMREATLRWGHPEAADSLAQVVREAAS